jgi:hypothetical protein
VKRGILFIFITVFLLEILVLVPKPLSAQEEWKTHESNCCSIKYIDDGYLNTFTMRIGGFRFTSKGLDNDPLNVRYRVDEIMEKVQAVLDMHPTDLHITILLYPDHPSVERIFRQFTLTGDVPLAFYSNKTKSIYVNVDSITDGVLAHEMAHAVINFYFKVPPPAKMQEILAQYVDLHIWD